MYGLGIEYFEQRVKLRCGGAIQAISGLKLWGVVGTSARMFPLNDLATVMDEQSLPSLVRKRDPSWRETVRSTLEALTEPGRVADKRRARYAVNCVLDLKPA